MHPGFGQDMSVYDITIMLHYIILNKCYRFVDLLISLKYSSIIHYTVPMFERLSLKNFLPSWEQKVENKHNRKFDRQKKLRADTNFEV